MTAQRIVIAMHDFFRGGTERVAITFARLWLEAGRDVTILCGATDGGLFEQVDSRVKVVVLDPPMPRTLVSRFRLGQAMAPKLFELRPDLVFLPGNFHLPLARGMRRAGFSGVIVQKVSNPPLPDGILGLLIKPFYRYFARSVDGFAAMNHGLAREVSVLAPGKAVVMLRPPFDVIAAAASVPYQPGDGVWRIFWAGRLEPQKDVGLALETIQALNRIHPAHLTLLGNGAERPQVEEKIRTLHLQDKVTLLSHVPDIAPYYAYAHALLVTSRYEGGPAVAVEALAHGTPVVTTDCSYLVHEVLTIPESGRVVASRAPGDLAAALAAVCEKPRPALETLRPLAMPFAPEISARAFLDWFDQLVRARVS
jgi:glycosyltransferase involved in cell wall biosynthesis